eukprot:1547920-Rhodomonas_salina.4
MARASGWDRTNLRRRGPGGRQSLSPLSDCLSQPPWPPAPATSTRSTHISAGKDSVLQHTRGSASTTKERSSQSCAATWCAATATVPSRAASPVADVSTVWMATVRRKTAALACTKLAVCSNGGISVSSRTPALTSSRCRSAHTNAPAEIHSAVAVESAEPAAPSGGTRVSESRCTPKISSGFRAKLIRLAPSRILSGVVVSSSPRKAPLPTDATSTAGAASARIAR